MTIKFEKIKTGDILYDIHSRLMGNTTMRTMGCWDVKIIEIFTEQKSALVSWNGNPPEKWSERRLTRLRAKKPEFEESITGQRRIKRKTKT